MVTSKNLEDIKSGTYKFVEDLGVKLGCIEVNLAPTPEMQKNPYSRHFNKEDASILSKKLELCGYKKVRDRHIAGDTYFISYDCEGVLVNIFYENTGKDGEEKSRLLNKLLDLGTSVEEVLDHVKKYKG